jgi:hypothetical protein
MAFNPFHAFRKHQKVIFAGLTILCMVTFVLAGAYGSRGGDFFGWLQGLVGNRSANSEARLYNKDVSPLEIQRLRQQRLIANQFMTMAVEQAHQSFFYEFAHTDKFRDLRTELVRDMRRTMAMNFPPNLREQILNRPITDQDVSFLVMLGSRPLIADALDQRERAGKKDEANVLRQLLMVQSQQSRLRQKELYFGGTTKLEDLTDFLMWRHQADILGIHLTEQEVLDEFYRETLQRCNQENQQQILKMLRDRYANLNRDTVVAALSDEFRVRLAQIALGYDTSSRPPSPGTPYDFWQYFEQQRTESTIAMLKIPVRDAEGKLDPHWAKLVDALPPPTDKELITLFNKYKNQEGSGKPGDLGFKHPRRVQVEWVSARPDSTHYRQQALKTSALLRGLSPAAFEARLLAEYDRFRSEVPAWRQQRFPLNDTGTLRAEHVATQMGLLLGVAGTRGDPVLPLFVSHAALARAEHAPRVRVGGSWIAAGATGSPFTALGIAFPPTPQDVALLAVRARLLERIENELAESLMKGTLDKLKADIKKDHKLPADALKKYDLQHGATEKPLNNLDIAAAKGLEAFKQAYQKQHLSDTKGTAFASLFFQPSSKYAPEEWPLSRFEADKSGETFLYWTTEDEAAKPPDSLDEVRDGVKVRDKVKEAWRFLKARELARKEAENLAGEARAKRDNPVSALEASPFFKKERFFTLGSMEDFLKPVARLSRKGAGMHEFSTYEEYQLPTDKIAYSGQNPKFAKDFVDKLLALQTKGDTSILWDEAEENYYVAVLAKDRVAPSVEEFYQVYAMAPLFARFPDAFSSPLLRQRETDQRTQLRKELLERLRTDADLWINPDFKKGDRTGTLEE